MLDHVRWLTSTIKFDYFPIHLFFWTKKFVGMENLGLSCKSNCSILFRQLWSLWKWLRKMYLVSIVPFQFISVLPEFQVSCFKPTSCANIAPNGTPSWMHLVNSATIRGNMYGLKAGLDKFYGGSYRMDIGAAYWVVSQNSGLAVKTSLRTALTTALWLLLLSFVKTSLGTALNAVLWLCFFR